MQEAGYGIDHLETVDTLMHLGLALKRQDQCEAGEVYTTRCLRIYEKSYLPDHPRTSRARAVIDEVVKSDGKPRQKNPSDDECKSWSLVGLDICIAKFVRCGPQWVINMGLICL